MLLRQPLALLLLLGVLALPALGQFSSSQPKFHPRREDIKYIRCQACELLAKHAYKQIREMKKQATPSKPVRGGSPKVKLAGPAMLAELNSVKSSAFVVTALIFQTTAPHGVQAHMATDRCPALPTHLGAPRNAPG